MRALGHLKIAAIGPATGLALARYHLMADLDPGKSRSEGLAEALAPAVTGTRVLLARADRGRTVLQQQLGKVAEVHQVTVYQNRDVQELPNQVAERILEGTVDWITLTSSAITTRLHALLPEAARQRIGREVKLASLSPVTSATANDLGWSVAVEASRYTWDGLLEALVNHVATRNDSFQT
jgi:uroporphyrinogen III methyltransferase / synthase